MTQGLDPRLAHGLHQLFGLGADLLHLRADLAEDLLLDSLSAVELQVWLEDLTGVRIPSPIEGPAPRTLGDLQARLHTALDAAALPPPPGERDVP